MALYTLDPDAAQLHYYQQKVAYFGKLQRRLDEHTISQEFFDNEHRIFEKDLENPDNLLAQAGDFNFSQFEQDVASYVGSIAGKATNILTDAIANAAKGAGKGFLSSLSLTTWVIILIVAGYFTRPFWKRFVGLVLLISCLTYGHTARCQPGNYFQQLSTTQINSLSNALYYPMINAVSNAIVGTVSNGVYQAIQGRFVQLDANFNVLVTNNIVWTTNTWAGPTNTINCYKGYQVRNSFTAESITGIDNVGAGLPFFLYTKNLAATNWNLTFPPTVKAPDGISTFITVTNGQAAYVGFDPTQETNVVTVHYF